MAQHSPKARCGAGLLILVSGENDQIVGGEEIVGEFSLVPVLAQDSAELLQFCEISASARRILSATRTVWRRTQDYHFSDTSKSRRVSRLAAIPTGNQRTGQRRARLDRRIKPSGFCRRFAGERVGDPRVRLMIGRFDSRDESQTDGLD
jgi:hypothetical protein